LAILDLQASVHCMEVDSRRRFGYY